ncbi:MAG: LemA family protein [Clostridiales bacterium]|nr:LemA family protein [Clostridiales bacterium]
MKKLSPGLLALIVVLALAVIIAVFAISNYNALVSSRENVNGQMANIDTQLQRRMDLIPNLVNTVKGYNLHEKEILTHISDARARLAGAGTPTEKAAANSELEGALNRLLAIAESYPDLKANTQFTSLMDELSGTENRISVARRDYNEAVKEYNKQIQTFPRALFASLFGFEKFDYFEAVPGAEAPSKVDFSGS